ncbi:MAG: hypothetical protein QXH27_05825 [Candidatus Micrarchaeia archaeon]
MRLKPAALDIETKMEIGCGNTSDLGLAVACLIIESEKPRFFEEGEASDLLAALAQKDLLIIGHNIQKFDYEVLRPYWPAGAVERLLPRTFDTMLELARYTRRWHSLGDLAFLNFGERKKEDGAEVPALWRRGERERVKAYCAHDALLALRLYKLGRPYGKIRIPHNGRVREILVSW